MATKRIIVYGGTGALGNTLVKYFRSKNYWIASIDLKENQEASANVLVDFTQDWNAQMKQVEKGLDEILEEGTKVDAIFNVAGGWAGGNASSQDLIQNSDLMWKQSVWSSTICAHMATKFLSDNGTLTLPGAAPALGGTSGMIGYGMAKAAVHQLTKSLAEPGSGLPKNAFVACILPIILDTPMNRKWMPKADTSKWTPLSYVSELYENWLNNKDRPLNGALVKLETEDNQTRIVIS